MTECDKRNSHVSNKLYMICISSKYLCVYIYEGKVKPLQARCGPEGGYRYSSTLP